jgi:hypothetical protein
VWHDDCADRLCAETQSCLPARIAVRSCAASCRRALRAAKHCWKGIYTRQERQHTIDLAHVIRLPETQSGCTLPTQMRCAHPRGPHRNRIWAMVSDAFMGALGEALRLLEKHCVVQMISG